mgnify:CR=1 FL=1
MFNKMSLYRVKKGLVYLRYFGPKEFMIRLKERIRFQKIDYGKMVSESQADQRRDGKTKTGKRFRMHP